MEFILATERTKVLRVHFINKVVLYLCYVMVFIIYLKKELYYKWNSLHNKEFLLNI